MDIDKSKVIKPWNFSKEARPEKPNSSNYWGM